MREIKIEKEEAKKKQEESEKSQEGRDNYLPDLNAFVTVGERRRRYSSIKKADSRMYFAEDKSEIEEIFLSQINSQGGNIVDDRDPKLLKPALKIDLMGQSVKKKHKVIDPHRRCSLNVELPYLPKLPSMKSNRNQISKFKMEKGNIVSIPLNPEINNDDNKSAIGSILSEEFEVRAKKLEGLIEKDNGLEQTNRCIVCEEKIPDCVFEPCGHGGICYHCCDNLLQHKDTCPFCRVVKYFYSQFFFRKLKD